METVEKLLAIYLLVAMLAVMMTRREQLRRSGSYGILDSVTYLICLVWPLPVMAMLIHQGIQRPGR